MALYESKKIGIDENLVDNGAVHDVKYVTAFSDGMYQLSYGGTTSVSGGGSINIFFYDASDPQFGHEVDRVFVPQYSTTSLAIAHQDFILKMKRNDRLGIHIPSSDLYSEYKFFYEFKRIY